MNDLYKIFRWLSVAMRYFLPWLLVRMEQGSSTVLDCLAEKFSRSKRALLSKYFPDIFLKVIQRSKGVEDPWQDVIFRFVVDQGHSADCQDLRVRSICFFLIGIYCPAIFFQTLVSCLLKALTVYLKIEDFIKDNILTCMDRLLLHMSEDEMKFVGEIQKLQQFLRKEDDDNLMADDSFNLAHAIGNRYFGVLLKFRRALYASGSMDEKRTVLNSLKRLIEILPEEMTGRACLKILLVLRNAPILPTAVAPVWLVLVEKLPDSVIKTVVPLLFVGIRPLLGDKRTARNLIESLFRRINQLLSSVSISSQEKQQNTQVRVAVEWEKQEILDFCIVASRFDNAEMLQRVIGIKNPISDDDLLRACLNILRKEQPEVKDLALVALKEILESRTDAVHELMIGTRDSLNESIAGLIVELTECFRKCKSSESQLLAAECLGLMGAVDPGRLGLELSAANQPNKPPMDRRAAPIIFVDDSSNFLLKLLTNAAKTFIGVSDSALHDQCSLSIQVILKHLECQKETGKGRDLWNQLDIVWQQAIEPLLETTYRGTNVGIPVYSSAIFNDVNQSNDSSSAYTNWLSAWIAYLADMVRKI